MEQLSKLRPDRDLQCYFRQPSAIAALSAASPSGFTVSGCWREQFDWAVLEWNRDNVFEHPLFRNLPDGDLSGIHLSYRETRTNCIPLDSTLWPTVDWPYLRVWTDSGAAETLYQVPLANYATAAAGSYTPPTAAFTLNGTLAKGDFIELAWLDQHFNYKAESSVAPTAALLALASTINANQASGGVTAAADGNRIVLTYMGMPGSNGNRIGVYATVQGGCTESWTPAWATFSGGTSPTCWEVNLDFAALKDIHGAGVPVKNVRKLRWTWAADLQAGDFERTEFSAVVTDWTVTGANAVYSVAGPGSRRIQNDSTVFSYRGVWSMERGNYSGGSIHFTTSPGAAVTCSYSTPLPHSLYLGTRYLNSAAQIAVQIDGGPAQQIQLHSPTTFWSGFRSGNSPETPTPSPRPTPAQRELRAISTSWRSRSLQPPFRYSIRFLLRVSPPIGTLCIHSRWPRNARPG